MNDNRNYDKIFERLELLWSNEILDRCCISVVAPKNPSDPHINILPDSQEDLKKYYTDGEWILKRSLQQIEKSYYAGDALPMIFPYFGTGGHAKYIAPESAVRYEKDTIWIHPVIEEIGEYNYDFDCNTNKVLKQELDVLKFLASEANGRYFVGMPDNCGSYDALAQLRGNENLMMDFLTDPDEVKLAGRKLVDILIKSGDMMFSTLKDNCRGGSAHSWMNTMSKGKHLQLQCDLSVMISNDTFKEFIKEELETTANWLDNAIYHLDGMEQIRHLDDILSVKSINMIQWVQVAGQPPAIEFIPTLRKIQQAGKGIVLAVNKDQVKGLLENLSPKGLILLVVDATSPDEADRIVKLAESY
jgi:hypothetical protein